MRSSKKKLWEIPKWIVIVIVLVLALFPVYWLIATSFKTYNQIFSMPPRWFFWPTIKGYLANFLRQDISRNLFNSIVIACSGTVLSVTLGSIAAYSFARFKFKGSRTLPLFMLSLRMLPPMIIFIPLFMILHRLRLINTYVGIILPYTAFMLPFVIWILIGFFEAIPEEVEESALIDGCTRIGALIRVVLPLAAPGLVAVSILTFTWLWNEFLLASVVTRRATQTLPVAISLLIGEQKILWNELAAIATMVITPVIVFAIIVQRYLVAGLTKGAIK